jgi:MoaA/NifB/PqqE/SkfB family radical SAM enzyme
MNNSKLKVVKNVFLGKYFGKKTPLCIDFRITTKCNNKCEYCNVPEKTSDELNTEQIFSMLDEAKRLGCIYFDISGGEPLLRKDIGQIIDYAKNLGLIVGMVTNGKLVHEKIKEIKNLDTLAISLDGSKEVHDKLRGEGSYSSAVNAIKIAKGNNLKVMLFTVLSANNIDQIDSLIDFAEKEKVFLHVNKLFKHNSYTTNVNFLVPNKKEFKIAINKLIKSSSSCIIDSKEYLRYLLGDLGLPKCYAGKLFCRIDPNGDMYPCQDMLGRIKGINVNEYGFKEAFKMLKSSKCSICNCALYIEFNNIFAKFPFNLKKEIKRVRRLKS